jgi:hypothetical protein
MRVLIFICVYEHFFSNASHEAAPDLDSQVQCGFQHHRVHAFIRAHHASKSLKHLSLHMPR